MRFIIQINMPPNTELKTSLNTHFIGTIKIRPIINNIHIQVTNISKFIFTLSPQKNSSIITTIFMLYYGQIFYTAILFFVNNLIFSSFSLSSTIFLLFAILIK